MRESDIVRQIMIDLGNEPDFRIWRNNTGALTDTTGRLVKYGLAPGSADLIGILAPSGRFIALEVKTHRRGSEPTEEQIAWGDCVSSMGGIYAVVRSAAEAREVLEMARQRIT